MVYHSNESKEQFSSFDRFRGYNKSSLNPVENIHIEYNILILLPHIRDPQNYKIEIDIHSRAALINRATKQIGPGGMLFRILANQTGEIKISYVDYNVSLNFMIAIEQWFQGLRLEKESVSLRLLKKHSHHFSFLFKYISVSAFLLMNYNFVLPRFNTESIRDFMGYAIFIFGFAYVLGGCAAKIGDFVEQSVDSINPLSFVSLNRGDDKLATETRQQNRGGSISAIVGVAVAVVVNVFSSYIASYLGIK
ncbi:hypothetical protein [Rhizobium laguerreae]|uniref:hypothetical protein n=1 Tax=Rhizobium laguerreae TaxID=1076926 RepID=UPI001C91A17B|nr:hypothetical protein [Rhizobium laguerreae]MBY3220280.1 hypothetical protein [Rhizobium laguerreae]